MGDHRALRLSGRARGVEDRDVVVGLARGTSGGAASARSAAQSFGRRRSTLSSRATRGSAISSLRARDVDFAEVGAVSAGARARAPSARRRRSAIDVPESCSPYSSSGPVHHAFSGVTIAPASTAAPERHRPFRQVAHDDGDAVARLDAVGDQLVRERARRRRGSAATVARSSSNTRWSRGAEHGGQRRTPHAASAARSSRPSCGRRGLRPRRLRASLPGCGQQRVRLLDRHGRKAGLGGRSVIDVLPRVSGKGAARVIFLSSC